MPLGVAFRHLREGYFDDHRVALEYGAAPVLHFEPFSLKATSRSFLSFWDTGVHVSSRRPPNLLTVTSRTSYLCFFSASAFEDGGAPDHSPQHNDEQHQQQQPQQQLPLPPHWGRDVGDQVAEHIQYRKDMEEHEKAEIERMEEEAGNVPNPDSPDNAPNLCPEGKQKCIEQCQRSGKNWEGQKGCVGRCWDACTATSTMDDCPEGKPKCVEFCERAAGSNDEMRISCKARCVNACCPDGLVQCKETCDNKDVQEQPICKAMCDTNCMKLPPGIDSSSS